MGRRSTAGFGALSCVVALALAATACSSSDSIDASAFPRADAPAIGLAVDAAVTGTADLPTFDDGNGAGLVPDGGHYRVGVRKGQAVVTATLDARFPADQIVTASFDTTRSPDDAGFGVVCRMRDPDNYYRLGVSNDGTYAIQRVTDGDATVLTGNGLWMRNEALRNTPGAFTIRAECVGRELTLFESNREIVSTRDTTFTGPSVGVFVESFAGSNAAVDVGSLSVRSFRNRARVTGVEADGWNDLIATQRVARRCVLLDPKAVGAGPKAEVATRCGPVVFVQMEGIQAGEREYARILRDVGAKLATSKTLPNCPKRADLRGPLPPPTPQGFTDDRVRIGRVACVDLGDSTAVVWLHDPASIIGFTEVQRGDRARWEDYGRDWPPFAYETQPG